MKRLFYIDMDGVMCDFSGSEYFQKDDPVSKSPPRMYEVGFFENLPPMEGALWAIRALLKNENLDIHVLTQPVKESNISYTEKANWIAKWIPELSAKLIMTQNKEHLSRAGRVLVDDAGWKWKDKWEAEGGTFVHFNVDSYDLMKRDREKGVDCPRTMWEMIVKDWANWSPDQPSNLLVLI